MTKSVCYLQSCCAMQIELTVLFQTREHLCFNCFLNNRKPYFKESLMYVGSKVILPLNTVFDLKKEELKVTQTKHKAVWSDFSTSTHAHKLFLSKSISGVPKQVNPGKCYLLHAQIDGPFLSQGASNLTE